MTRVRAPVLEQKKRQSELLNKETNEDIQRASSVLRASPVYT